jgi:hypothetical protein
MPTFAKVQIVSDVARATKPLRLASPKEAIEQLIGASVEACSEYHGEVIPCRYHSFMAAVHEAFLDHRPLVLSPDMLWLLIAQGFARCVNNNAELMRSYFVTHQDKKTIEVRRDDFLKGSPENPWPEVFSEFSDEIRLEIGNENHSRIVVPFSTTGSVERAANELALMDSMKSFFSYVLFTLCGIPEVRLEGLPADWNLLRDKTRDLGAAYELGWWTDYLVPILDRIAANAAGTDDSDLWRDIYKYQEMSGGPIINGWVVNFFPYLEGHSGSDRRNSALTHYPACQEPSDGIGLGYVPSGLSKVPFLWQYFRRKFNMEFIAGFTAFTQDAETLAVRPKIGWAVREKSAQE